MDQPHRRRRNRLPLSCDPCRIRKLKCNREKPCQNCTARKEQADCAFRGPKGVVPVANPGATGDAMQQRINHLEDLVKKLITERDRSSTSSQGLIHTPESTKDDASDAHDVPGVGKTVMDGVHSVYVDRDDWSTVLHEINELKRTWTQEQDSHADLNFRPSLSHTVDGSSLLFNQVKPIERIEILSTLPPKPEADRLISWFFHTQVFPITLPPILYEPQFMREYNEHWKDPSQTSFMWLGLLFSILGIAMLAYHQYGEPPEYEGISESLFQLYRTRTAQCLLSGDIAKCLPYTVEALRLNATAELNRKDDMRRGLWIMTGVVVRAAINMGYHRDPSQSPGLSPLQAEYRRRVWLSVTIMDDMASFFGGFPRTMSTLYSNTMEPRNLNDWELTEDTKAPLPPTRPITERTHTTYLIVKGRLFRALGRVADYNSDPSPGSYETVLEIDRVVTEAYESFPPQMKVEPVEKRIFSRSRMDHSNLTLLCMYHKGLCILHRKFLAKGRFDSRFKFSRDRCISSALKLLDLQERLLPPVYEVSQTRQILTFAAMIIFLELEWRQKTPDTVVSLDSDILLAALDKSAAHWAAASNACDEAWRAHQALVDMLSSFRARAESSDTSPQTLFELPEPSRVDTPKGSFEQDFTDMDFDWVTWDAFIEETSFENGPMY